MKNALFLYYFDTFFTIFISYVLPCVIPKREKGGVGMEERFQDIKLREDGFLEIELKSADDFDDYIYQKMQKDNGCLPCVRDHHNTKKLYYDTKGYVSLCTYMHSHIFEAQESCEFLIYVLESMLSVNTSKPVMMNIEYMYMHHEGGLLRFLVLPLCVDKWAFQKAESVAFLGQLMEAMRLQEGYEAFGYLAYMQKYEEMTLPMVLQGLHDLHEHGKKKPTLFQRLLHLEKEEAPYVPKDIPFPKAYPQLQIREPSEEYRTQTAIYGETMVLCADEQSFFVQGEQRYQVKSECYRIGRTKDNELCIDSVYISSHHACFYKNTMELEDLSSSNGTFVNGVRIHKQVLQDGDQVTFAQDSFQFIKR